MFFSKESSWSASGLSGVGCLFLWAFFWVKGGLMSFIVEWTFFFGASSEFKFILFFDWMSFLFFSTVAFISSSVLCFSGSYMKKEPSTRLFIGLVLLFIFSMFFMVFSLNLVSLLLGWDGLGLVSYILVVYYQSAKANAAGMVTALSNRVGDAALLLSIALLMEQSSWDIVSQKELSSPLSFLIMLAGVTKSAQIPFSAWLPAAMAAPTPVSALVHSSTLVTAGVYLMIRFFPSFNSGGLLSLLAVSGVITAGVASVNAFFETDLKKTVALSTLSQLGVMVFTLSTGLVQLAFFHLLVHAFFKALLFMCSGKLIHSFSDSQDLRSMGGCLYNLPITSSVLNLSNLALCGFPFLAGFYSKDCILETLLMRDIYIYIAGAYFSMVGLSVTYSLRLAFFSLIHYGSCLVLNNSEEEDWSMMKAKSGLAGLTLLGGALGYWVIFSSVSFVSLPLFLKYFTTVSVLSGGVLGVWLLIWDLSVKNTNFFSGFLGVNSSLWTLSFLSGSGGSLVGQHISSQLSKMSGGWFELLGGQGSFSILMSAAKVEVQASLALLKNFLWIMFFLSLFFYL